MGLFGLGMLLALDIGEVLTGAADFHVHLFVADVIKSFGTVARGIWDRVLSGLVLPAWFRHTYCEYDFDVLLWFELAAGLSEPWSRVEGIPQGCPLSTMFIVALYSLWYLYLSSKGSVELQFYAENPKCVYLRNPIWS